MVKDKISKKVLEYTVVFEPAKEGGYVATVPALTGCVTQGETFEETVVMIKDAIKGYLAVLRDQKEDLPYENSGVVITKVAVGYGGI